nr:tetratricopeptide repeat protein [Methanobacterium formicicum]
MKKWLFVSSNVLQWVALDEDETKEFYNNKFRGAEEGDLILVYKTSPHRKITHIFHLHKGEYQDSFNLHPDDRIKLSRPIPYPLLNEIYGFRNWMKRPRKGLYEIPDNVWKSILRLILKNNPVYTQTINSFIGELIRPGELEKYYKQGTKLVQEGEIEKAIKLFDLILDSEDGCLPALYWRGKALEKLGRHQEAIETYEKLLSLESTCEAALKRKGICHHIKGELEESNRCLDEVLLENPQDVDANLNKGYNLQKAKLYDESIVFFR